MIGFWSDKIILFLAVSAFKNNGVTSGESKSR